MIQPSNFVQRDGYHLYQTGKHFSGSYIRVYIPDAARQPGQTLRVITYLHGFALCMPSFYEEHLEHLVKAGYIVFFPDFQRSCYPNTLPSQPTPQRNQNLPHLRHWWSVATGLPGRDDRLTIDETPSLESICEKEALGPGLTAPLRQAARSVARSLVLIILILKIWSWFQREYGKNLIHLLSTVGISLFHKATESLDNAIALTQSTWADLCEIYPHWRQSPIESYAFGHSLGGLVALSLPHGYDELDSQSLRPQQIIVADPAASTEMGIPKFAIALLKLFRSPFTQDPILITKTGRQIDVPVVILHGGADKLVTPQTWRTGTVSSANFEAIATSEKQVYFSYSQPANTPPLVAFHNQAVTSTQYYDDGLFENFGGVKKGANAYNFQYVWPSLELILTGKATPHDLLSQLPPHPFDIRPEPPARPSTRWFWSAGLIGLTLSLYWIYTMAH